MHFEYLHSKIVLQELGYNMYEINPRLHYFKPNTSKTEKTFAEEISYSLTQNSKFIHPKFFYDQTGSKLFEKICQLPEYYLTRTEISILKYLKNDLPRFLNQSYRLVELGSGASTKTKLLLDILDDLQKHVEYFPIDISDILKESSQSLLESYANLHITGVIDTYESGLKFIKSFDDTPNLIAFLGSSFGNFEYDDGINFLHNVNSTMKQSDLFLIGIDLVKDKKILEDAYDDSLGVTAQFNLNVLQRINNELDANFNIENFSHMAEFNEKEHRIEMYLRSNEFQSVNIPKANLIVDFLKDELIHTEHSHKYTIPQIENMMEETNFEIKKIWQDNNQNYSMALASKIF